MHPLTVPKVSKESPKLLNNLRKSRKSRNRLRKAFIVTTKTAVAQITAGSSLLVDEDFKHQGLHDHLSKCDSCEELKTVL